ncbi:MAG: hypothetical protein IPN14_07285 [Bacteroidetes bacterium]|jgi:hypothetical protein|nr:hypothetical protein [Bacteroidota bacterium]MBK9300403.1 hypothetical protein [Bacteroidota bacterium]
MFLKQVKCCKTLIATILFIFLTTSVTAQQTDTDDDDEEVAATTKLKPFPDSIFKFNVKVPVAKRAGLFSALLPGLGQVYNKQYWKLGVVVAATGAVTGFMIFNTKQYNKYQQAYLGRIDTDPATTDTFTNYQTTDIDLLRKTYRKYVEYTVIAGTVCYLINILDAFTSAHLKTFDMSKNISFKASPYYDTRKQFGMKITIAKK